MDAETLALYFNIEDSKATWAPEKRLAAWVLVEALLKYKTYHEGHNPMYRIRRAEITRWLDSGYDYTFSFDNVVDILDLSGSSVRQKFQAVSHGAMLGMIRREPIKAM